MTDQDLARDRARALYDREFVPNSNVSPEYALLAPVQYIAAQSFHIRVALERIASALEAQNTDKA